MAEKLDLRGYRFGTLLVIAEAAPRRDGSNRRTRWACRCDCGRDFIARTELLRAGKQTSCGHKRPRLDDMTGRRFGRLVASERTSTTTYKCVCDCGTEKLLSVFDLKLTRSCGCSRRGRVLSGKVAKYTVNGKEMTVSQMAEASGLSHVAIRKRLAGGMSPEEAMRPPTSRWGTAFVQKKGRTHQNKKSYAVNGTTVTFEEAAKLCGVTVSALRNRVGRGMTVEQAVAAGPTMTNFMVELFGEKMTINELASVSGRDRARLLAKIRSGMSAEEAAFGKRVIRS
jgi:hypothetical protein